MKIWQYAAGEPWAITEPALQAVLSIASREIGSKKESLEVIEARLGQPLDNTHHVYVRDGVAIVPVVGPLFRYANLFTRVSGATSYELLAQDITNALDNPSINSIILTIDSPGGEVNGCSELAQLIADGKQKKPIMAYISGDAASGAYWIASACTEIIASPTSGLGSIGVVGVYRLNADEENTTIEIVSSQSPYKRLNVEDDNDRARIQQRIDALAEVFITAVADYRGVSPAVVIEDYGGGDVFVGQHAVDKGLADRLGTFEKLLTELTNENPATVRGSSFIEQTNIEEISVTENKSEENITENMTLDTLKATYPDLVTAIADEAMETGIATGMQEGQAQEQLRIGSILKSEEAKGREGLANYFAFDTELTAKDAMAALAASPKAESETVEGKKSPGFESVMAGIANPDIEPATEEESVSEEAQADAVAKRIASSSKY